MAERSRRLDWRSGGWLLALAALMVLGVVAWRLVPLILRPSHAIGDGRTVDSYGFRLEPLRVSRATLTAAGFAKDSVAALVDPPTMRGDAVLALNESRRGKYLVTDDRVIGVVVGDEVRAYPIRVLNWHEVVNDTLGGLPIAVTYHPLCDSVVVFDRRVAGETLEFGVSGLLWNSNLLMYDRRASPDGESLWSQLLARAVAGPAAAGEGEALRVMPASVTRWDRWLTEHPDTTVVEPDPLLFERYERNPYGNYFLTGKLRFPVEPLPPSDGPPLMQRMIVIERDGQVWQRLLEEGPAPPVTSPLPGIAVHIDAAKSPVSVRVDAPPDTSVFYSLWFAWYATHPDTAVP